MTPRPVNSVEATLPREVLQEGLSRHFGRPVLITAMTGRPLETSSHPIDRLGVEVCGFVHRWHRA